mmetsp:Transcript_13406/g.29116  ORF Transcript_13406/g.29116 Transcript_13406/m.29116 type:complete len:297 (+) Transcript_13406:52-942(+)
MSDNDDGDANEAFLIIKDIPIHFSEDWNTGIGGGLWSTGLAMSKYFEQHADDVVDNLQCLARMKYLRESQQRSNGQQNDDGISHREGISAMELGSGNGFLSVCLLALAAHQSKLLKELVVTDLADHLALMATTLKANPHVWDQLAVIEPRDGIDGDNEIEKKYDGRLSQTHSVDDEGRPSSTSVIVAEHMWGEFPSNKTTKCNESENHNIHNEKYDFIFGTDLAYRNSLHKPLIASLVQFSHQHTLCLIGITMTDTQPVFFDLLTKAGFRYEKLADHLLEREFRGSNFGIVAIQRR